ncbi:hypothetical protein ABLE91_13545 [Aquabacter sp. CN5-332]|uniref:hypothetical protein n=1 Tax=Aquabacter sp. CN5-332 TaxID=3156608 RepID=UPI0032B4CF9C
MFDPTTMVGFHTWLSLIAIVAGVPVVQGLLAGRGSALWTNVFLVTAILTSVTGFLIPAAKILPSHITGVVALLILAAVLYARYVRHLSGAWGAIYAGCMVASLYLLVFVGLVQVFLKVPAANRLAPTGSEPPFAFAQGLLLVIFVVLGYLAVRRARRFPLVA